MGATWIVTLTVVAGCSFQISAGPTDASPATADARDAPVDTTPIDTVPPVPCVAKWLDHSVTFDTPVPVPGIDVGGMSERDPTLTRDELVIFWVSPSAQGADDDVYQARRGALNGSFTNIAIKQSLSVDDFADSKVTMTADDLYAVQSTQRPGGQGEFDLWQTSRTTGGTDAFGSINQTHLGLVNDAGHQLDPFVSGDGRELYFAVGVPQRIVLATRGSLQDDFGAPVDVPGINGGNGDADPALSADGRVLLFTSNRPGGLDYADLWYATRADVADNFGPPRIVPGINSMQADGDAHLSVDGCRLYFASSRANATYNLMVATVQ